MVAFFMRSSMSGDSVRRFWSSPKTQHFSCSTEMYAASCKKPHSAPGDICVCVCVCVWERESDQPTGRQQNNKTKQTHNNWLVDGRKWETWEERKREREKERCIIVSHKPKWHERSLGRGSHHSKLPCVCVCVWERERESKAVYLGGSHNMLCMWHRVTGDSRALSRSKCFVQ